MGKQKRPSRSASSGVLERAHLERLDRDQLSILLYLSLPRAPATALLKRLNVTLTGFRPDGLSDIERCDLIADEFTGQPEHRRPIVQAVEKELGEIPDAKASLGEAARVLGPLFAVEAGTAKAIVRLLLDPEETVRATALQILDALADFYLGEPQSPEGDPEEAAEAPLGAPPPDPTEGLRREVERAKERADAADRERVASREQLQAARREAAESHTAVGELRRTLALAESERDRLRTSLLELQASPHSAAELRLRKEIEDLKERIGRLEEERRLLRAEEARLKVALGRAQSAGPERTPEPPRAAAPEDDPLEEAPSSWLLPVFTKEFYDSLDGWEQRLQRAALQKAMLLAQDHRHPSLRAIPLEGLPNLYRIRIATDVRLLYRRGEKNLIEILRLIDREDLDRWIKVEKVRG